MYGIIHVVLRAMVIKCYGQDTWKKLLEEAGADEHEHFHVFHGYHDNVVYSVVNTASVLLDVPVMKLWEYFGYYFVQYCLEHEYDKMLRTLGGNFISFLQNLDSLHNMLALTYTNLVPPSFRCERREDGSWILHYYSCRGGLHTLVIGLLHAVGDQIYKVKVTPEVLKIEKLKNGVIKEHVTFLLHIDETSTQTEVTSSDRTSCTSNNQNNKQPAKLSRQVSVLSKQMLIDVETFCDIFPYHVLFNSSLQILQSGYKLQILSGIPLHDGLHMNDIFTMIYPKLSKRIDFQIIQDFINASYILSIDVKDQNCNKNNGLSHPENTIHLKGQMMWLEKTGHMMFIGSPKLSGLNEMMEKRIFFSDIPNYDVTREMVLLNQQRIAEIEISKQLEQTTAQLQKTSAALEEAKQRTDALLYQMLPVKVANQLRDGRKVEAEKYDSATLLFSDIVGFTNMAAAVQPMDIVDMLNDLYKKFDDLVETNNVYKVETIGDAYMVVGGVPEVATDHAQRIANQGIDMVLKAQEVMSPVCGKPIQIRVGVHSGSVVAGVVGDKMPRYCLFGDTVNTASRMETHGLPGKIHCSSDTHKLLVDKGFVLKPRGKIVIKGKGRMETWFLTGVLQESVAGPGVSLLGKADREKPGSEGSEGSLPGSEGSAAGSEGSPPGEANGERPGFQRPEVSPAGETGRLRPGDDVVSPADEVALEADGAVKEVTVSRGHKNGKVQAEDTNGSSEKPRKSETSALCILF